MRVTTGVWAAASVAAALVLGGCASSGSAAAESSPTSSDARAACIHAMEGLKLGPAFTLTSANYVPYSRVPQTPSQTAPSFPPDQPVALCNITDGTSTATSDGLEANVLAVVADTAWWPLGDGFPSA